LSGRVLLLANNFPPTRGGSAVVYGNLARHGQGRILVMAPRADYTDGLPIIGWREHDRRAGYTVVRPWLLRTVLAPAWASGAVGRAAFLVSDLALRLKLTLQLLGLVRREGIDAVCLGELVASGWLVEILKRLTRLRVAIYIHGEEILTEEAYDPGHARAARALRLADRIFAVSGFSAEATADLVGPEHAGKIRLIENGVDTVRFRPGAKRADLLATYGLEGRFVFVTVCRLLEKKGVDTAIRAMKGLAARHPEVRLLVVGTGPYEAALRELVAETGTSDVVVFAGNVPESELADHYRLGDVFVMANRALPNGDTEGFGLVFLEANACGIAVIGGRDGGTAAAVRDGENGLLVDGHSLEAVEAAMLRLCEDGALRERLAARGLEIAAESGWGAKAAAFVEGCLG
jgi:phosphatidyl-myo-inositol dimannoside synthase